MSVSNEWNAASQSDGVGIPIPTLIADVGGVNMPWFSGGKGVLRAPGLQRIISYETSGQDAYANLLLDPFALNASMSITGVFFTAGSGLIVVGCLDPTTVAQRVFEVGSGNVIVKMADLSGGAVGVTEPFPSSEYAVVQANLSFLAGTGTVQCWVNGTSTQGPQTGTLDITQATSLVAELGSGDGGVYTGGTNPMYRQIWRIYDTELTPTQRAAELAAYQANYPPVPVGPTGLTQVLPGQAIFITPGGPA